MHANSVSAKSSLSGSANVSDAWSRDVLIFQ